MTMANRAARLNDVLDAACRRPIDIVAKREERIRAQGDRREAPDELRSLLTAERLRGFLQCAIELGALGGR